MYIDKLVCSKFSSICYIVKEKYISRKPGSLTKHVNEWCQVHMRLAKLISHECSNWVQALY